MTPPRKTALVALLLLVPVPSIATWFGLIGFEGPVGQTVYSAGKVWIVALPLVWLILSGSKVSSRSFL